MEPTPERSTEGQIFDFDTQIKSDSNTDGFDPAIDMDRSLLVGIGSGFVIGVVAAGIANREILHQIPKTLLENPSPEGVAGGLLLVSGGIFGAFIGIFGGLALGSIRHHWHYNRISLTS